MGIVNRIQNAWTRRQLFNPDTLVLHSVDGNNVTVNARPGRTGDEVVTLPVAGTIVGFALSASNTSQTISNAATTVAFQTDAPGNNGVERIVNEFHIAKAGYYIILVEIHVEQLANSNILKCWVEANNVAIPYAGTTIEIKTQGDVASTMFLANHKAVDGEVVRVRALCSAANGAQFSALPAAGGAPPIAGIIISFIGYLT